MSQTLSPSLARCYGMARVARVWKISRASVYRSFKETPPNTIARRRGRVGECSDAELAEHIRRHIAASRLHGEEASPSFVREPEGNGVAERFIRTLKENLLWVRTFDTIEELRAALVEFATRYNETWLVARHGYRTPARVRADQCRLDPNTTADLRLAA